jgi:hypothetical protein
MRTISLLILFLFTALSDMASADTIPAVPKKKLSTFRRMVRNFSRVDTNYIEPQKYNFTVMLQNTTSFEGYTLKLADDHSVVFSPEPSYKLGPYFGWRFVFLGYTIDFKRLKNEAREALALSLYAPQVGVDLFYRKSGDNYRIRGVDFKNEAVNNAMRKVYFDGFETSERGFNLYYIFNHNKFSYPAAYSQSIVQRRSASSALAGMSYSRHSLDVDWDRFHQLMDDLVGPGTAVAVADTSMHTTDINYTDLSLSGGYAYNWVFARNWLFDISLQLALGYKQLTGKANNNAKDFFRNFDFKNLMIDGVGRTGIVWNNMRWYAGASAVFHTYNYQKSKFSANSTFGNVYVYVGYNFGLKGSYRKKHNRK